MVTHLLCNSDKIPGKMNIKRLRYLINVLSAPANSEVILNYEAMKLNQLQPHICELLKEGIF